MTQLLKKTFLIVPVILLISLSCGKKAEETDTLTPFEKACILMERYLTGAMANIDPANLNDQFYKNYSIPGDVEEDFKKIYTFIYNENKKLPEEWLKDQAIQRFLLNRYIICGDYYPAEGDPVFQYATADNPIFVAFSILIEKLPNFKLIGKKSYIKQLALTFEISEKQVALGVWYALQKDQQAIAKEVIELMKKNLTHEKVLEPQFYIVNILIPYLTFVSNGFIIHGGTESEIRSKFAKAFKSNVLSAFIGSFRGYLMRRGMNWNALHKLNSVMKPHGYRFFILQQTFTAYRILDQKIPINAQGIDNVILLKKANISVSTKTTGTPSDKDKDAVLLVSTIKDFLEHIDYIMQFDTSSVPQIVSGHSVRRFWNVINPNLSMGKADTIARELTVSEYTGKSQDAIIKSLLQKNVIYVTKYKWDHKTAVKSRWLDIDREISAHLAACMYSSAPLSSFMDLLNTCHNFYAKNKNEKHRDKLKPVIKGLWDIAVEMKSNGKDNQWLIEQCRLFYSNYSTLQRERKLPPLNSFETGIIKAKLSTLPEEVVSAVKNEIIEK
ncbi:hypothetical protein ACFL5S_00605 [Fibrobacterota bacterium]